MNTNVIIVGVIHHNTLSLVRCFGQCGIKVIFLTYGSGDDYVSCSKYINASYTACNSNEALQTLYEITKELKNKPIVITADDDFASLIDLSYDKFKDRCYFFNAGESGRITYYMDKSIQTQLAKETGFNIPITILSKGVNMTHEGISYPVIIKPKESIHGGKKIAVCTSEVDLIDAMREFNENETILIQEYIVKDYEIVILGCSYGSKIIIPGYIIKHRDYLGGTTYSTIYSSACLSQDILDASKKFIEQVKYEGLFGIECIFSKGKYYFIEANLRNDATTYSLCVAGANLPMWYYSQITGERCPEFNVRSIESMVEFCDLLNVLKCRVNPFKWIKQLRNCECKYFYNQDDIKPYRKGKKLFCEMIVNRIVKLVQFR